MTVMSGLPTPPPGRGRSAPDGPRFQYRHVVLPRGTSRAAARRMLAEEAEYGSWEIDRLRLFADGTRRVVLRRRIIRAVRTG